MGDFVVTATQTCMAKAACWDLMVAYATDPDDDAADLFNMMMGWQSALESEEPTKVLEEATEALKDFPHAKQGSNK